VVVLGCREEKNYIACEDDPEIFFLLNEKYPLISIIQKQH
jgi:hypothetical protein